MIHPLFVLRSFGKRSSTPDFIADDYGHGQLIY